MIGLIKHNKTWCFLKNQFNASHSLRIKYGHFMSASSGNGFHKYIKHCNSFQCWC